MKGKLALGGAGSGSGRFNAKFMRTLSLQPGGSSGGTWQVRPCPHPVPPGHSARGQIQDHVAVTPRQRHCTMLTSHASQEGLYLSIATYQISWAHLSGHSCAGMLEFAMPGGDR